MFAEIYLLSMKKAEFLRRFHHIRNVIVESDYPVTTKSQQAAVLIPIIEHKEQLTVLLTKRAKHLKHHPGQISFPGGKVESSDISPEQTAIREAYEEVGLMPDNINVIGKFKRYRTISQYRITPIVALVKPPKELFIDANEVDLAFEVPLDYLCHPSNQIIYSVNRKGIQQKVCFISFEGHLIWGVTASIIRNLSNHLYDTRENLRQQRLKER